MNSSSVNKIEMMKKEIVRYHSNPLKYDKIIAEYIFFWLFVFAFFLFAVIYCGLNPFRG